MSAREFVMIVRESSLGTVMASPVAGTDSIVLRLVEGSSCSIYAKNINETIMWGGGLATAGETISDHYSCDGTLKTKLYPSQAKFFTEWATHLINAGQTLPWVTTEPQGDLASCSVYHAVKLSDGSYRRRRFAGMKVSGMSIDVSRDGTSASISLDLTGTASYGNANDSTTDPDATEFPAPADADYPTGPYVFSQTSGYLIIRPTGSTVRSGYSDLSLKIDNKLDSQWFETRHKSIIQFCGRSSTLNTSLYLKNTPDDRSVYEALTYLTVSLGFHNGVSGQNMAISYHGKNIITDLPYETPIDKVFMYKMALQSHYDPAVGSDVDITYT